MDFVDYLNTAIHAILSNKKRAMLTSLGVIVGMGSIILLNTVGSYINNTLDDLVKVIAGNKMTLTVEPMNEKALKYDEYGELIIPESNLISNETLNEISRQLDGKVERQVELDPLVYYVCKEDGSETVVSLIGCSNPYFSSVGLVNCTGREINKNDCEYGSSSIYIEERFARLFFHGDAIGNTLQITDHNGSILDFTVVGTFESDNVSSQFTQAFIPYTYVYDSIGVKPKPVQRAVFEILDENEERLITDITSSLVKKENDKSDWKVSLSFTSDETATMRIFVSLVSKIVTVIAAVSLLVGGLGIMNVMIVSVTERTREIGIRKACGASPKEIRFQFVLEAFIMTFIGTIVGTGLGLYISKTLLVVLFCILKNPDIDTHLHLSPVLTVGAAGYSVFIGILCGLYPAEKAVKMDLVKSLFFE